MAFKPHPQGCLVHDIIRLIFPLNLKLWLKNLLDIVEVETYDHKSAEKEEQDVNFIACENNKKKCFKAAYLLDTMIVPV